MNKPITVQELVKECLKQMDAGNGDKVVLIKNDTRFGNYNPIFSLFEDNTDIVCQRIKSNSPNLFVTLG